MSDFQQTKAIVRAYYDELDGALYEANAEAVGNILRSYMTEEYEWFGVHPFNKQDTRADVISVFWEPLCKSWRHIQRREDIFMAGKNMYADEEWTISMGHFMGIVSQEWIGIRPVQGIAFLRYAEFHCVKNGKIVRSAFFCDIIDLMRQAGLYPLPMQTGSSFVYPGPRTHDGLLFDAQDSAESEATMALLNRMIDDLSNLNNDETNSCPPDLLRKTWHEHMMWYGPAGIGASYTIPLYQKGHQLPFRRNLTDKVFNGHICRFSEGNYAGFFGWPNLNNTPTGGFLGLPKNEVHAAMRVVDMYRREGDKLAENWVIIDLPHWLLQQGLDVLARGKEITDIQAH